MKYLETINMGFLEIVSYELSALSIKIKEKQRGQVFILDKEHEKGL